MTDSESTVPLSEIVIQDTGRALPVLVNTGSSQRILGGLSIPNGTHTLSAICEQNGSQIILLDGELQNDCLKSLKKNPIFTVNYKEEAKNMSPDELKNTLIRTLIAFGKKGSKDIIDYNSLCFMTSHILILNPAIEMSSILPLANSIDIMTKNELLTQIVFNRLYF